MKKAIHTDKAPKAIGPYSQAIETGNMLFVSGQIPIIPQTGELSQGSISEQTKLVMDNIGEILKEAGYNYNNIVKTTCLLANIKDFQEMNNVYGGYFSENPPTRSAFAVKDLPKGAKLEIEVIASK